MIDALQIPPEIFGKIFELGILNFGIEFIPPVCLVCSAWNNVVLTTPRLWGIVTIEKNGDPVLLNLQISKAKAAPLTIIASRGYNLKRLKQAVARIVELSHNWTSADVPFELLTRCHWSHMYRKLEVLVLSGNGSPRNTNIAATQFFDVNATPLRLHTFIANGVPRAWTKRFLSPSITHLEFAPSASEVEPLRDTLGCISCASEAIFIKLDNIHHSDYTLPDDCPVTYFPKLATLEVSRVLHPSPMLCGIVAPSLQTLSIRHTPLPPRWDLRYEEQAYEELKLLQPFMSQWSQGIAVPSMLHTLELVSCLDISDVGFLIRWLARLPHLTRLILHDDAIGIAAELPPSPEETNLVKALASPQGAGEVIGGWLCPSLMELYLSAGSRVADLLSVAHMRGGIISSASSASQPCRLRKLDATLCSHGTQEEIDTLKSLVDCVVCGCLACSFKIIF